MSTEMMADRSSGRKKLKLELELVMTVYGRGYGVSSTHCGCSVACSAACSATLYVSPQPIVSALCLLGALWFCR